TRDVFRVTGMRLESPWGRSGRQRIDRRVVRLFGTWAPGSSPKEGDQPFVVYDAPGPFTVPGAAIGARPAHRATILEVGDDSILVEETLARGAEPYDDPPAAVTPSPPPPPGQQRPAIEWWAEQLLAAWERGEWPRDAVV